VKINLANKLTFLRIALIFPFLTFTIHDNVYTRMIALVFFVIASLTDLYDGKIAREQGLVTVLGTFLDPLADKLLISAAFIAFVQIPEVYVSAWMVILIIGREFLITGLRTLAVSQNRVLPAQPAGKFKTTSQITAIITILVILIANSLMEDLGGIPKGSLAGAKETGWLVLGRILKYGPYVLTLFVAFLTLVSGGMYIRDNIDLFNERPIRKP
jgi:CDP-diacylglycerol--glycerol-3-phosphate 3-phosphatidyltransferase